MTKVATPQTTVAATALLTRFGELGALVSAEEALRQAAIAEVNANVDAKVGPMTAELAAIETALSPWWSRAKAELTGGKRKSIELGGCKIGTRTARETLTFTGGDDRAALAVLADSPVRAAATEIKRVLDKAAITAMLKGETKARGVLEALGFALAGGEETFFVSRIDSPEAKVSAR